MKTKKLIVGAFLCLLGFSARSQGLEQVIVEKYYITNAADSIQADAEIDQYNIDNGTSLPIGALPVGSVTYRFYADMLPGYELLSVYADGTKSQNLVITSTTPIYNHPYGSKSPVPGTSKTAIKNNLLALDSYYTMGGAASAPGTGQAGILKTEDNGVANNVTVIGNPAGVLLNNHPDMGIPLTTQDGIINSPVAVVAASEALFTPAHQAFFADGTVLSNSFVLNDGSWIYSPGVEGPAASNRLLIAQITTKGTLHWEFNILVKPVASTVGEFYATTPGPGDQTCAGIFGTIGPNDAPTVTIDSPLNGAGFVTGDLVAISATATDVAPGTIAQVEFFVDGVSLSVDNTGPNPYTASYPSAVGTHTIVAIATDNQGALASDTVTIIVQADPDPTVSIITPVAPNLNFTTGDAVLIEANANDAAPGTVTQVAFFVNGAPLSVDNTGPNPYAATYPTTAPGTYTLSAIATDDIGQTSVPATVVITVQNDPLPTVSITSPANGATFVAPAVVAISATANDAAPGSVTQVEFFVDGASLSVDNSGPAYDASYVSAIGTHTLTAIATDNLGQQSLPSHVVINVLDGSTKYTIGNVEDTCLATDFCLPVTALVAVDNVIGYDMTIQYDVTKVAPSGVITVSNDLINSTYVSTSVVNNSELGQLTIAAYFNSSAPANAEFNGLGDILCVGFNRVGSHPGVDTALFSMLSLEESYVTTVTPAVTGSGKFITFADSLFHAGLRFWLDNQPIKYDVANPGTYLITNIYGSNASCNVLSAVAVQPDLSGNFDYNIHNGTSVSIKRDIAPTTDVQPVIGAADAILATQIVLSTIAPNPSVYQMIAADVTMDGKVSSGDISQINQRSVLMLPEFKQAWNYDNAGNPIPGAGLSKDWVFLDSAVTLASPAYQISATYPADDLTGYSKSRVPVAPFCLPVPVTDVFNCPDFSPEIYRGVMLGDVNGNYATHAPDGQIKKTVAVDPNAKMVFDMAKATVSGNFIDVPVAISTTGVVNGINYAFQFNESSLSFHSVINHNAANQAIASYNVNDKTLRGNAWNDAVVLSTNTSLVSLRFNVHGSISASDIAPVIRSTFVVPNPNIAGDYIDVPVKFEVTPFNPTAVENINNYQVVNVYPNPASSVLNVELSQNAIVEMMDATGKQVVVKTSVNANEKQVINIENLANGIYMMKVYNDNFVSVQKVVINK